MESKQPFIIDSKRKRIIIITPTVHAGLTFPPQVLSYQGCNVHITHGSLQVKQTEVAGYSNVSPKPNVPNISKRYLREISVLVVDASHAVQPGLAELGRAGVGLGQAVLEVHQHLRVVLVLLHLLCGHQHRPDALRQVLHIRRKRCVLRQQCVQNQKNHNFTAPNITKN